MYAHVKAIWTEALNSGKYKQAKGRLSRIDADTGEVSHCCLGVLTQVAIDNGVYLKATAIVDRVVYGEANTYGDEAEYTLHPKVAKWAGFDAWDTNPMLGNDPASYYNDTAEFDFPEIAKLIDKHL